ncbi:hypothetical protein Tco_1542163, partial [Tanacetum coccineum]
MSHEALIPIVESMSATVSRGQGGDGGGDDPSCPPARPSGTGCR